MLILRNYCATIPDHIPDIIALLVVGVLLIFAFLLWQNYLEKAYDDPNRARSKWTPPPLMRITLWGRAHGRIAVVFVVAFLNWCSFQSFIYWSQVYQYFVTIDAKRLTHIL